MRKFEARVERAQQILRRAADLGQLVGSKAVGSVRDRVGSVVARRGEGDGADPLRDERRLLVERKRKREVDELAQDAGPRRTAPDLGRNPRRRGLDERSGPRARRVPVELEPDRPGAADRVQVDDRGDVVTER